jgi:hypothetical protein
MAASMIFTPMLPIQPVYEGKTVRNLLETLGDRVELTPVYQRGIRWTAEAMGHLVHCMMNSRFIPPILLYKLQPGDERSNESYETEVIDGQHRLFVLSHYFHSKMVELPGKKAFLISLDYKHEDKTITHLFYKETAQTVAWQTETGKKVAYMTKEQRDHFNGFYLSVAEIRCPLILDQRRALFIGLNANGIPVRGSDLYKNMTDVPLVRFISDTMRWEKPMLAVMRDHCLLYAKQYWCAWLIRFYLIQNASDPDERAKAFMTGDTRMHQMIKKGHVELNSTPESEAALEKAVTRFFSFIGMLKPGTKLTPTQFFACFTHLLDADKGREELIATHMKEWGAEGKKAKEHQIWENRAEDSVRQEFFERAVDELEHIVVAAQEVGARKTIPKKIREAVWAAAFGEDHIGSCTCCTGMIYSDQFEAGHCDPHKFGGKAVLDNLRPICRGCNRSMGTQNLWDYKRVYGEGLKQAEALQKARREAKAQKEAAAGGGASASF